MDSNGILILLASIGTGVAILGLLVGIWFQFLRKSDGKSTDRSIKVGRDVEGPVVTGDQTTTVGQLGIAVGAGYTGPVNIYQQAADAEATATWQRIEQKLDAMQETIVPPHAGATPIDTNAPAAEATGQKEQLLDEAIKLQGENKQREAIDALYAAFGRDLEPLAKAQLHNLLGNSFFHLSKYQEAEGHYRQALDASRQAGHRQGEAATLGNLGLVYRSRGDLDRSEELHKESLVIHREIGNRRGEANQLSALGLVDADQGDLDSAEEHYTKALHIHRDIGYRLGEAQDLGNLGIVYRNRGDLDRAEEQLKQALAMQREIGDRLGQANQLGNLGAVYKDRGDFARAEEHYQQALEINREIGYRLGEAQTLGNLGSVYLQRGDLDRADEHLKQALDIQREIGDKLSAANQLGNLGLLATKRKQGKAACQLVKEALAIYEEIGAGGPNVDILRAKLEELGCG